MRTSKLHNGDEGEEQLMPLECCDSPQNSLFVNFRIIKGSLESIDDSLGDGGISPAGFSTVPVSIDCDGQKRGDDCDE